MPATNIVDIGTLDVRSAPVLARDCAWAIVNWNRYCPPDQVISNIPIVLGGWDDDTIAPAMISNEDQIDYTDYNADPECDLAEVDTTSESCELIAPNMQEIGVKSKRIAWKDLITHFCKMRNILPSQMCIFNPDGTINEGSPLAIDFTTFVYARISKIMVKLLTNSALTGDAANANEFDGLYTQLANGWLQSQGEPCPDLYNTAQSVPWDVLTGNGGTPTSPDALTVAGQTLTLWGTVYPVPEGINLAQLMEDVLIDAVELNWAANFGGVDAWELHMPWGLLKCLQNTVACMHVCKTCGANDDCSVRFEDEALRTRYINMMNSGVLQLMPSMTEVIPLQSQRVADNEMWLGPGSIGGRPSYVLFLEDIERHLSAFSALADTGFGLFEPTQMSEFIAPTTQDDLMTTGQISQELESRAFFYRTAFEGELLKCLRVSMIACAGLITCNRHLWAHITGVSCCSVVVDCPPDLVDVTGP